ncbi:hypothetical protein DSO57_1021688, partial [Entomophthora muscae]
MNERAVKDLASPFSTLRTVETFLSSLAIYFFIAFSLQLIPSPIGLPGIVGSNLLVVAKTVRLFAVEGLVLFPCNLPPTITNPQNPPDHQAANFKAPKDQRPTLPGATRKGGIRTPYPLGTAAR